MQNLAQVCINIYLTNSIHLFHSIMQFLLASKCCCVFSLVGVFYLGTVAYMLQHDSIYLKVGHTPYTKPELADSLMATIFMYLACAIVSGIFWFRSRRLLVMVAPHHLAEE